MFRMIYSSMAAGGGVHGKDAGIALITMTEGGVITEEHRLSTETFLPVGEIITEIINGTDIRGNISGYSIGTFSAIGKAGKKTGTGKNIIPGACRDCLTKINRGISNPISLSPVISKVDKVMATIREKADRKDMIEDRVAFKEDSDKK
jgi:hypothetical protein